MKKDERQVSPTLDGIRRDHVARYEWAGGRLKGFSKVLDVACGIGYGSKVMAGMGHTVIGMDIDREAIEYARKHYKHPRATFAVHDATKAISKQLDAAIAFECIEHMQDPRPMLKGLKATVLLASVPNEDVMPWRVGNVTTMYHHRHYTKGQFESLLNECGWFVTDWFGQEGPESEVIQDINGRTLIAHCVKGEEKKTNVIEYKKRKQKVPEHVSILGLGPSLDQYTNICKRLGGRHKYCDETWAINALGNVVICDRVFHMDDVRIQEIRAKAQPESNIAAMLEWMKTTNIPIVTSRPHPDYPALEPFPLIEVLNEFDTGYFNSTAAYAVAYAVWLGVKKISLFGVDFTYPDAHDAEKGRACVEFWLGMATERGIKLTVPKASTLLDAIHTQRERFYGYDTLDLRITQKDGVIDIEFSERTEVPSAEEVEESYNHDNHPNALMKEVKSVQSN